jgi:spore coat polysaccharide biosynthesis predicted glycosyltransferase SpsG
MGHLYRVAAIIEAIPPGINCSVWMIAPDELNVPINTEQLANSERIPAVSAVELDPTADAIVVDVPESHAPAELLNVVGQASDSRVIAFGNWTMEEHRQFVSVVDVVVDFSNHPGDFRSTRTERGTTTFLLGPRYMILREEYRGLSNVWSAGAGPERVTVLFGGSDPSDLTTPATEALLRDTTYWISVVLGPGYEGANRFRKRFEDTQRVRVSNDPPAASRCLRLGDILVTSPGLTMYEGLYLGMPVVSFFQNELQQSVYGSCRFAYPPERISQIAELVDEEYERRRRTGNVPEVGSGLREVVSEIVGDALSDPE